MKQLKKAVSSPPGGGGTERSKTMPCPANIPVSAYFNLEDKTIRNEEVFRINYNRDLEIK